MKIYLKIIKKIGKQVSKNLLLSIPDEIIKNLIVFSNFLDCNDITYLYFNIEYNIHQKLKYNYGLFLSDYIFNTNYKKKM